MIKLLSKETIDKIAAGEVVIRPLNVVKELVENSIDAGATAINIETASGGSDLIRVSDNGSGIEASEVKQAFMRHATSKIEDSRDLYSLNTLGFRGEALSSIAAVSKLELITKTADALYGTQILIEGGEVKSEQEIAAPNGSNFFVRDLFYNTPVRKKFLKSNTSENAGIEENIMRLALSKPEVSFSLIQERKEKIFTSGSGNLKNTIFEIFGLNVANSLIEIDAETEGFKIYGFIGESGLSFGNRNHEIFFVNGRSVKTNVLETALEDGFDGYLMGHRFPFCVLNLSFPDGSFDVNVHPSKMEVRFDEAEKIQKALSLIIHAKLSEKEDIDEVALIEEGLKSARESDVASVTVMPFEENRLNKIKEDLVNKIKPDTPYTRQYDKNKSTAENTDSKVLNEPDEELVDSAALILNAMEPAMAHDPVEAINSSDFEIDPLDIVVDKIINKTDIILEKNEYEQASFISKEAREKHRIIGQVFDTYWLIEYEKKLYIIDQHAAHEKVLFERIMKSLSDNEMSSQQLMPPIVISLSPTDEVTLNKNMESISKVGFAVEHFGGRDYKITGIPFGLPVDDPESLLLETLSDGLSVDSKRVAERVAMISCKAAVKGNNRMSTQEMDALLDELLELENPYHCPHGRPTMISFSRDELDKKFRRIL